MSSGTTEAELRRAFSAARELHGPSAEEWATMAAHIRNLPSVPGGGTPGGGGARRPVSRGTRALSKGAVSVAVGGLGVLGAVLWGTVGWFGPPAGSDRGAEQEAASTYESTAALTPERFGEQQAEGIAFTALEAQTHRCGAHAEPHVLAHGGRRNQPVKSEALAVDLVPSEEAGESAVGTPVQAEAPPADDGPLLRDVARLSKVEAALREQRSKQALSLLSADPVERLRGHATALRAQALCQLGQTQMAQALLENLSRAAAPASVRARAEAECGKE